MSSNQITQARSMNGIIDFDGVENLNVDNIDAKNIDVENLEIETNLKVNNIDISPQELSFIQNANSNIQTQLNNAVKLSGTQVISGDKTFSGTTTLTGDLIVNSKTLSPTELSALDGIQSNIQEQINNINTNTINNAVTLSGTQTIIGDKTLSGTTTFTGNINVNTTTINPDEIEQLKNISTSETIQQQLDNITTNISNNLLTKSGDQTISGDNTISGTTTLTGDLNVNSTNISPTELSALEGIQSNIQQQLDNAGFGTGAMTLNTQQVATGQKTFTEPVGITALRRDSNSGTIIGFLTGPVHLIYASITGSLSVANSTIVGEGVNSTIVSQTTRPSVSSGYLTLTNNSTPTPSSYNTDGYYSNTFIPATTNYIYYLNNTTNIQPLSGTTFFTGVKWNSSSSVTIPSYGNDFVLHQYSSNANGITMLSNSSPNINRNFTAKTGYLSNNSTFTSLNTLTNGDFLEGTGLIPPVQITAVNGNDYTLTSPNTITPTTSINTLHGYFDTTTDFYYYNQTGTATIGNFLYGANLNGDENITAIDLIDNELTIQNNTFVSSSNYTKVGYIQDANNIIIDDTTNLQVGQFVKDSNITLGKHYITAITNNVITLADTTISVPTPVSKFGYLFSSSILVGTGYSVGDFITHPTDIPDITTKVSVVNSTFVNLSTSNNTPTPNNKTYNGFSPSSTEFYYNNDDTNVSVDYYLKDNSITSPTTNHLITAVDTTNKKLTTANLPVATPTLSVNGYTNLTLNKIITATIQSIFVGNGIDSTLINTGSRFVSSFSGVEIGVSGTLNSIARLYDTKGFCSQSNQSIVYDPNTRLGSGDFLVDYDLNAIPVNSIISSISSLGFDMYQVALSSSLPFTPSTSTIITNNYKPTSNTLAVNSTTLNNKVYQDDSGYRYITGTTANPYVYNTNDSGSSDLVASSSKLVVILTQTEEIYLLSTYNDTGVSFSTLQNKYIQENTLVPTECFLKTANAIELKVMNESIKIEQNLSANFKPINYSNGLNNPYRVGTYNNEVNGNAFFLQYKIPGVILYINRNTEDYTPQTGDIIIDCTGTNVAFSLKAKKSVFSGLYVDMMNYTGTAPIVTNLEPEVPVATLASTIVNLYLFVTPTIMIFNQNTSQYNILVYFHPPNNSINICVITGVQPVFVNGQTRYQYTLSRGIPNVSQAYPFDIYPNWNVLQLLFGNQYSFSSVKFRPAGLQYKFYTPNSSITIPDNQVQYESVPATNISIYPIDSYNSYEKKTFELTDDRNFEIFNPETINEFLPISYNSFEKLNFTIYTSLDTFTAQTSYNVTFPTNTNNEVLVLQDVFQILTNKYIRDLNVLDELRLDSVNSQMRIGSSGLEILDFDIGLNNIQYKFDGEGTQIDIRSTNNTSKNSGTKLGYMGYNSWGGLMHNALAEGAGNFGIMQNSSGKTLVNASSGQSIDFRINNVNKFHVTENVVSFDKYISSPTQPMWYFTGGAGNQSYGPGSRIGSYSYTGGQSATRSFNIKYAYGGATSANDFDNAGGAFYANQGEGIYQLDLYLFCNNATTFNGRISLQTNSGRNQPQYNMSVNRNTTIENCTLLSWTIYMNTGNYAFFSVDSSVLTAFLGGSHTNLRVIKLM